MEQASNNPARGVRMMLTMLKKFNRLAGAANHAAGAPILSNQSLHTGIFSH
jgi:hypothetical protein